MTTWFGSGASSPSPEMYRYPAPSTEDDEDVKKAELEERYMLRQRRGRQSTILTSGLGDTSSPYTKKATALGGSSA